jgi:predicted  nucleic acid-binding Zn-ribbon protein
LPESHAETEVTNGGEKDRLESSLQTLWLKARRLSDILLRLKNENESLRRRVEELEGKELQLSKKLQGTEQELLQRQSNGSSMFTHEEKEAFVQKIRELIAKINSRL